MKAADAYKARVLVEAHEDLPRFLGAIDKKVSCDRGEFYGLSLTLGIISDSGQDCVASIDLPADLAKQLIEPLRKAIEDEAKKLGVEL